MSKSARDDEDDGFPTGLVTLVFVGVAIALFGALALFALAPTTQSRHTRQRVALHLPRLRSGEPKIVTQHRRRHLRGGWWGDDDGGETSRAPPKPTSEGSAVGEEIFVPQSLRARSDPMSNEPEQARHEFGAPDEREVLAHEPVDSDMATDYTRVGENVADVLASAQRAAAQMLRSAREEADRIRSDAQEQAAETEQRARYVAQEEVRRQEALAAGAERYEERLKNLLEVFRGMTTQLEDLIRTNREAKDRDEDSEEAEQDAEAPADEAAFEEALRPERPTHAHTTWPRGR